MSSEKRILKRAKKIYGDPDYSLQERIWSLEERGMRMGIRLHQEAMKRKDLGKEILKQKTYRALGVDKILRWRKRW